jgi:hypothetical protein
MLLWLNGDADRAAQLDGSFRALLELYETPPRVPYCALKARTRSSYAVYLPKLHKRIGSRRIDECDGRDVLQEFDACCEAASGGSP